MVLVCGIHGSGKTVFSRRLSYQKEIPYYSASQLIDKAFPLNQRQSKNIDNIAHRQIFLLNEINELNKYNDNYILDGHLCVVDQFDHIIKVSINVLLAMHITEIIVMIADPLLICERLKNRDKVIYDKGFIEKYQDEELSYAKYLSKVLNIDLHIVHSDNLNQNSILLSIKPIYAKLILYMYVLSHSLNSDKSEQISESICIESTTYLAPVLISKAILFLGSSYAFFIFFSPGRMNDDILKFKTHTGSASHSRLQWNFERKYCACSFVDSISYLIVIASL